jgi:hypothetical protein
MPSMLAEKNARVARGPRRDPRNPVPEAARPGR